MKTLGWCVKETFTPKLTELQELHPLYITKEGYVVDFPQTCPDMLYTTLRWAEKMAKQYTETKLNDSFYESTYTAYEVRM